MPRGRICVAPSRVATADRGDMSYPRYLIAVAVAMRSLDDSEPRRKPARDPIVPLSVAVCARPRRQGAGRNGPRGSVSRVFPEAAPSAAPWRLPTMTVEAALSPQRW